MQSTKGNRLATATLEGLTRKLWGFAPNLMGPIVEQDGPAAALSWFARNMPRYERTRKVFGPVRTHIVCTTISMLNSCRYCTHGHAYALQLCYLQEHGSLFPLDETELVSLAVLGEERAGVRMEQALEAAGLPQEIAVIRRLLAPRGGTVVAQNADDRRLLHLLDMLTALNTCAVRSNISADQAHDPINKNQPIKDRYSELRRSSLNQSSADAAD